MTKLFPVLKGAEEFSIKGNNIGILISHGFMGTPQSVKYIGEKLAKLGFTVHAPRLKGHGTDYYDLEKCKFTDWFNSLEVAYKELTKKCSEIYVLGQSMGGTLALWLAHKYPSIKGIIVVNPALSLPAYEPLEQQSEPRFVKEGTPDIKAKNVVEITYSQTPITAIHELQKLMKQTPSILSDIQCPILGIRSKVDHVVPPENTDFILDKVKSAVKWRVVLPNSYHVASMDNDKDLIVESSHQFVIQITNQKQKTRAI